eukprot:364418-Chlamydomonas_euryale.AAC.16
MATLTGAELWACKKSCQHLTQTGNFVAPPHARNSSCPCGTTHVKSASHGDHHVACDCCTTVVASSLAVCQQLYLPTLAFKAIDFCQLLKEVALLALWLAAVAAAAPNGRARLTWS